MFHAVGNVENTPYLALPAGQGGSVGVLLIPGLPKAPAPLPLPHAPRPADGFPAPAPPVTAHPNLAASLVPRPFPALVTPAAESATHPRPVVDPSQLLQVLTAFVASLTGQPW